MRFAYALAVGPSRFELGAPGDTRENLNVLKALGYAGVELAVTDPRDITEDLAAGLVDIGLGVATLITGEAFVSRGISLSSSTPDDREEALHLLQSFLPLASRLEACLVVGRHRGRLRDDPDARLRLVDSLKRLCDLAARWRVRLVVEVINRHDADSIPTLRSGAELIAQVGASNLGLLADTYHMHLEEDSLQEPLQTFRDLVWHVHLADTDRLAPGWGALNFRDVIQTLLEGSYRGFVGVEVRQVPDFVSAARQALKYLRGLEADLGGRISQA